MKPPRAIAFDLDGTLIDSRGDIAAALNHALAETGHEALPDSVVARFVGDGARMLCARSVGLHEGHPDVQRILDGYLAYYAEHPVVFTRWMPSARETLDELRGYKLALVTNKPRKTTEAVLATLGISSLFSAVAAEGDLPERKPSPAPILWVAERLGLCPEQIVVVGDGPQDVESGRRAGSRTVGVLGGIPSRKRLEAAGADVLIESLAELPHVMHRWSDATV
jgi:2-phosphoglycolate phosphatase